MTSGDTRFVIERHIMLFPSNCDAAFIAKALGTIAKVKGMTQLSEDTGLGEKAFIKFFLVRSTLVSIL